MARRLLWLQRYCLRSEWCRAGWHCLQSVDGDICSRRNCRNPLRHSKAGQAYNPSTGTYARGASASNAYGSQAVGQAYNPNTGAYGATHQASNAYGNYGSSVVSKNGQTAYTQHQTTAQGSVGTVQTSDGWQGRGRDGCKRQRCCGPNSKWQQVRGRKRECLQEHRGRLAANPGNSQIRLKLLGKQFCCCKGMGTAGKEQRVIGFQRRRRLAIQGGECSWFGKSRWWRWMGRSQVKLVRPNEVTLVSGRYKVSSRSFGGCHVAQGSQNGVDSRLLLLALIISLAACSKPDKPSPGVFASPDDASNALLAAVKSGDQNALLAIFGPDSKEIISSGDAVQDKNVADTFAAEYEVMHRWRKMPDGGQILLIGADNFAFPIPLKKNAGGQWFFDTAAGKDEILNRRIGRNELAIIDVCGAVADAQAEYFSQLHDGATTKQYAAKFISDPGKQNGLVWKSPEGKPESPLGPLAASASSEGYSAKPDAHTRLPRLLLPYAEGAKR